MGAFLEKGVSQLTGSGYTKRFEVFTSFVRTKIGIDDPFMLTLSDTKKTEMVANYIKQQYEEGSRGKKKHSDTAASRHYFTCGGHGVDFLGTERDPHLVLQKARLACKMSSEEMRVEKRKGKSSVKIALPDSIMTTMKEKYWDMYTWETKEGFAKRMTYLACVYRVEFCSRASEVCMKENPRSNNHGLQVVDVVWTLKGAIIVKGVSVVNIPGGHALLSKVKVNEVESFTISAVSAKCGPVRKSKVLDRSTSASSNLLDLLWQFAQVTGNAPTDLFFSRCVQPVSESDAGKSKEVRAKSLKRSMISSAIKECAVLVNFSPNAVAAHSLKKRGLTIMRHNGAGDEECNARGNHAKGSGVGRAYYDYTEERGPSHYAVDGVTQLAQSHLARLIPSTMILADSDDSSGDDDDDGSEENDGEKGSEQG